MSEARSETAAQSALRARLARLDGYITADPLNARLLTDAFDTAMALGDFEAAQRLVDRSIALTQAQPEQRPYWTFRQASIHMAKRADEDARRLLESLRDEGVDDPAIATNIAELAFRRGDMGEVLATLEPLATQGRLPAEGVALLLRALHRQGKVEDALRWFETVPAERKASPTIVGIASLLALDANRPADAKAWSAQALAQDAAQLEALVAAASIALGEDELERARHLLERALIVNANDGRTWSALAFVDMLGMRLDLAHAHFVRSLRTMPEHIGTWHGFAWCCLLERDFVEAEKAFQTALSLDRNFAESHGGVAVLAALEGRREAAQQSIERALRLDASSLSARYAKAILDGEVGDGKSVVTFARRLLRGRTDGTAWRVAQRLGVDVENPGSTH